LQRLVEPALRTFPALLQASLAQHRLSAPASPIPLVLVESLGLLSAAAYQNGQEGRTSSCREPQDKVPIGHFLGTAEPRNKWTLVRSPHVRFASQGQEHGGRQVEVCVPLEPLSGP
jgi:hypothetical protein